MQKDAQLRHPATVGATNSCKQHFKKTAPAVCRAPAKGKTAPVARPSARGKPLAAEKGTGPSIVRQVNAATGEARTVVTDERGVQKSFGEHTVSSFMDSDEAQAREWLAGLTDPQLRGFVQEFALSLRDVFEKYELLKRQLEWFIDCAGYELFGLDRDATEQDLDRAWRRMAKMMHPDKNGGTDEAKARFQDLREKYEQLKKKIQAKNGQKFKDDVQTRQKTIEDEQQQLADEDEAEMTGNEEAEELDLESPEESFTPEGPEEMESEEADAEEIVEEDRAAVEEKLWKMRDSMKTLRREIESLKVQLENAGAPSA